MSNDPLESPQAALNSEPRRRRTPRPLVELARIWLDITVCCVRLAFLPLRSALARTVLFVLDRIERPDTPPPTDTPCTPGK